MVHTTLVAIDENLPNINKTKHPNKKERNVQEGRTTNKGRLQLEHEQIKYSNPSNPSPSMSQGACQYGVGRNT
jgi:hypothetical protein